MFFLKRAFSPFKIACSRPLSGFSVPIMSTLLLVAPYSAIGQSADSQPATSIIQESISAPVSATNKAVDQLSQKLKHMSSLSADFSQQTISNRGQVLQTISGSLEVMKENRLRWQTEPPFEQLVVADGHDVWVFDRDLEQVTVRAMDNSFQETPALLLSGDVEQIADEFSVTAISEEIFNLIPKDDSQLFEKLTLIFDRDILQTLTIFDVTGQYTLIEFNDPQINLTLPVERFQFTPPAGVDVIDGR